jgi:hypothetical protein
MAAIQPISVSHAEKGEGIVVDRLNHYDEEKRGFIVQLGIAFYEHPQPAVHYHSPSELELKEVLDFPSDDFETEEETEETEEDNNDD